MNEHEYDIEEPTAGIDTSSIDMGEAVVETKDIDVTPDSVVDAIQRRRMSILMNGAPIDKDELSLMNDLGKTAQTQQRINVENKAVESDSEIAKSLAQMVTSGISLKHAPVANEKDVTPVTMDTSLLDGIEVKDELITDYQEEISLDDIMAADDLVSDN